MGLLFWQNLVCALEIEEAAYQQQETAVNLAQRGEYESAVKILKSLVSKYPAEKRFLYDYIVVLSWSDQQELAFQNFQKLNIRSVPDYVLKAVAKAARDNKKFNIAINAYSELLSRNPDDFDSYIGYLLAKADIGETEYALQSLLKIKQQHRYHLQYLEALAYVYGVIDNYLKQAHYYQAYLEIKPDDQRIRRQYITSLKNLGATKLALDQIKQYPDTMNSNEIDDIQLDFASQYIRWGILPTRNYKNRFDDTDHAIRIYNQFEQEAGEKVQLRKTYDLIVALHDRYKMQQAIDLFKTINIDKNQIPNYVLTVVANAYLYLEKSEKALEFNRKILESDPDNYKVNLALFYTYIELDDFKNAYQTIDRLASLQPTWFVSSDNKIKKPNDNKLEVDRVSILARAYGDSLSFAQKEFEFMLHKAPFNNDIRHDLGLVYRWRGWSQKAYDTFIQVLHYDAEHLSSQLGKSASLFNMREYRIYEKEINNLYNKFPENKEAQRQYKLWQSHNKRHLISDITFGTSDGNELGSREFIIDTYLYSKPIHYNYRTYLHFNYASADFIEGNALEKRPGIGLEYRSKENIVTAEINKGLNHSEDIGVASKAIHHFNDYLSLTMAIDINSLQAPIRGRRAGIDANRYALGMNYRWHESQQAGAEIAYMDFDDGNNRLSLQGFAERRVINRPKYKMSLRLNTAASINDKDNVIYYSPSRDFSLAITSDNIWRLYRRYEREFNHRLKLSTGLYNQEDFGTSGTWSVQYEHIWKINRDLEILYGVGRSRSVFDGEAEFGNALYGRIDWRF